MWALRQCIIELLTTNAYCAVILPVVIQLYSPTFKKYHFQRILMLPVLRQAIFVTSVY
jgi:hypothetical protein